MLSISPLRNSTFSTAVFFWFSRARASISSVISRPKALPVGPTRFAESSTSMPPPLPKSRTVSPGFSSASAVGLPHPSDARTAASGNWLFSLTSYRFEVIGSVEQQDDGADPQQAPPLPETTRSAA